MLHVPLSSMPLVVLAGPFWTEPWRCLWNRIGLAWDEEGSGYGGASSVEGVRSGSRTSQEAFATREGCGLIADGPDLEAINHSGIRRDGVTSKRVAGRR